MHFSILHCWKDSSRMFFSSIVMVLLMASVSSKLVPLMIPLSLEKRKKSHRARSGKLFEYSKRHGQIFDDNLPKHCPFFMFSSLAIFWTINWWLSYTTCLTLSTIISDLLVEGLQLLDLSFTSSRCAWHGVIFHTLAEVFLVFVNEFFPARPKILSLFFPQCSQQNNRPQKRV